MTNQEIKSECEEQYAAIKKAQERLEELRKICKHENTYEGTYSWRVGCYDAATICSDCGHLVKINSAWTYFNNQSQSFKSTEHES